MNAIQSTNRTEKQESKDFTKEPTPRASNSTKKSKNLIEELD